MLATRNLKSPSALQVGGLFCGLLLCSVKVTMLENTRSKWVDTK